MPFNKTWQAHGYMLGDADFYEIDYSAFGGIDNAIPADCAAAIRTAGLQNRVGYHDKEINWQLVSVANNRAEIETHIFSGVTSTNIRGCTEHGLWPLISKTNTDSRTGVALGGPYHRLFVRDQTLVIYSTLAPCLKCCNSLIGIARCRAMNIIVRCQQDYDFLGVRKAMDFTVLIPREASITSTASPASRDRVVFVLHNGNMDFSNRRTATFKGSMRPAKLSANPHRTRAGETCGGINLDSEGNNRTGRCTICRESQPIAQRVGSSTPWANDYDPAALQNK